MKVIVLTWGGLVSGRKQSKKFVVTTNDKKSAEAIVLEKKNIGFFYRKG